MRVLIVHSQYRSTAPSGENNVVAQEAAALRQAGHVVETFLRRSDDIASWSLSRKARLPVTSTWNAEAKRDLAADLGHFKPDVVHVHNTFPLISPSVLYACRDAGVPVVITIHNYKLLCASGEFFRDGHVCHDCADGLGMPGLRHGCYRGSRVATLPVVAGTVIHRRTWRNLVSAYVFISRSQRDLMSHLQLPRERVFVKPNFVADPGLRVEATTHSALYLGRLDAAKGLPLLMRAWDLFVAEPRRAGLRLRIAGGGPLEDEVRRWAIGHDSVEVLGIVPRAEAARLLQESTVAIVPSQWEETFGLVVVEAKAASVASLAPRSGSFPELIDDQVDGALFAPGDAAGLATAIATVDHDPERFVGYGRRARTTYEKRFRVEDNVRDLARIYQFAIDNPVLRGD